MKRVITYGTFDTLYYGHTSLLRRARALGDYLVVALSTDEFNTVKKEKNIISMKNDLKFLNRYGTLILSSRKHVGSKKKTIYNYIRLIYLLWAMIGPENSTF